MDDHSTDDTELIINELCKKYTHLKYLKASDSIKHIEGKKWALEEARKAAANEIILLTDADCNPESSFWIKHMASKFNGQIDVVLGVGNYKGESGFVNSLLQYETLFTAMSYIGFASGGSAYMGVGRNLAHRKSIQVHTKEKGLDLLSGDDDLYLQARLNRNNTAICIEKGAFTISQGPEEFHSWVRQKKRHYSTAFQYSLRSKLLLFLLKFSFYIPNYLFLWLIVSNFSLALVSLFVVRTLIWEGFLNKIGTTLHIPRRIYLVPCYEIFFSLFDTWITITNLMTKPRRWK
jgi:cellulose synthase/poly-beta-1,6-N-acetylglucosamine synthase-like glycosyltransferase